MGENDTGKSQMDLEKQEQNETEPEKNPVYAEVYESKSKTGSVRSSQNDLHHAYTNEANLSDVVIEEEDFPPEDQSPPIPVSPTYPPPAIPTTKATVNKSGKKSKPKITSEKFIIDYQNRDPENLQESIKVNFPDIIAEPDGTHSFNTIWGSSYTVYSATKYWLYRILTLVLGIPCALFWGIYFACLAFIGVWWIIPCIRAFAIKFTYLSKFWSLLIRTVLDPIFESIGLILSRIRVMMTHRQD